MTETTTVRQRHHTVEDKILGHKSPFHVREMAMALPILLREPLIYSHMAATAAWRDEMQGVSRSQGLFSLTRDATQQFARQAPSHAGCGQIGRSLSCTAWHRSPGYDLRRTRRDLPDLTRNAAHGGINQRSPRLRIYRTV